MIYYNNMHSPVFLERSQNIDLQPDPAELVIWDKANVWHALRGYDFAGLDAIMGQGILASDTSYIELGLKDYDHSNHYDRGWQHSVCVSVSPARAYANTRMANSFSQYMLADGLSLAINATPRVMGYAAGFEDEGRMDYVAPDEIVGLMLPEDRFDKPIAELSPDNCSMRATKAMIDYIDRTVTHLADLGDYQTDPIGQQLLAQAMSKSIAGEHLTMEEYADIQAIFMKAYSAVLATEGNGNPTLRDTLNMILQKHGVNLRVYEFSNSLREDILKRNIDTMLNRSKYFGSTRADNL